MSTICRLLALFAIAIFVGSFELAAAQQQGPKMFTSAEEACSALVQAVKSEDRAALIEILGPTANEIISGGNEIEDRNNRRQFVTKYQEMHRLVREPDGTINLYVGAENWPLPIIMKHKGNSWYFDPVATKAEILFRRIGRNEMETIQLCRELMNSKDYAHATSGAWPFHGYYFRILNQQSLAVVAYPAEYRSSGVMTFVVNRDGLVYQKDLGPRTVIRAKAITRFDPDATWKRVE